VEAIVDAMAGPGIVEAMADAMAGPRGLGLMGLVGQERYGVAHILILIT